MWIFQPFRGTLFSLFFAGQILTETQEEDIVLESSCIHIQYFKQLF